MWYAQEKGNKENPRDKGSIKWSQSASTETRSVEALCRWLVGCWGRDVGAHTNVLGFQDVREISRMIVVHAS